MSCGLVRQQGLMVARKRDWLKGCSTMRVRRVVPGCCCTQGSVDAERCISMQSDADTIGTMGKQEEEHLSSVSAGPALQVGYEPNASKECVEELRSQVETLKEELKSLKGYLQIQTSNSAPSAPPHQSLHDFVQGEGRAADSGSHSSRSQPSPWRRRCALAGRPSRATRASRATR